MTQFACFCQHSGAAGARPKWGLLRSETELTHADNHPTQKLSQRNCDIGQVGIGNWELGFLFNIRIRKGERCLCLSYFWMWLVPRAQKFFMYRMFRLRLNGGACFKFGHSVAQAMRSPPSTRNGHGVYPKRSNRSNAKAREKTEIAGADARARMDGEHVAAKRIHEG